ncbi:BTB/POZ domain-containing protein At5g66560 [Humulus lupulus]|uniref:BTB/POZ domain-containing protein At5g66560 n=1 Tax=Humulus lupulus TaxID=3486 RepID=UPI002B4151CF|nr:BTB/POZ domain-containing protein At5g66560 [Humulus lupulus]
MAASEKPGTKGQAWFCTTGLPSDVVVEVNEMTFHLHKFPLMSKSRRLHDLITEQETNPIAFSSTRDQTSTSAAAEPGDDDDDDEVAGVDEIEEVHCHIVLSDFPGGSDTFELAAKFSYGVKIDLTASNVAPLRCAGEFLDMTEEYSEDNLISKTERFFSQSVLKSLKDSIKALKSCERLMPLAESLGISQRCIDSIASRASSADPTLFGWPVNDGVGATNGGRDSSSQILWNGIETSRRRKGLARATNADSWLEELAILSLPFFKRLISAMKDRDLSPDMIESCLIHYAKKCIPGISRTNRKPSSSTSSSSLVVSESEQRELLETVISNLPLEKSSARSSTATRFLFGLLRTANILNISETSKSTLEKKLGSQLEQATLDDLLIPSYSYLNETLYDVDCVERILAHFLDGLQHRNTDGIEDEDEAGDGGEINSPALMLVGKLIDGYLSEIASDANLKPERFYNLAMSLPDQARLFHDGLYRAVDVYLKSHPSTADSDRERISSVLDCQKLTLEACTHAAQNERLPLRAVVQVLFFEQLQLRHAIAENLIAVEAAQTDAGRPSVLRREQEEAEEVDEDNQNDEVEEELPRAAAHDGGAGGVVSSTWRAAVRENQVLRLDMDSMRTRVHQLERECSTMRKVIEKIDKAGPVGEEGGGGGGSLVKGWRGSLTRRFGCKFKTQVCDSHEPSVVDVRKGGGGGGGGGGRRLHHHQS